MTVNDLIIEHKLNRRQLADKFGIPYATLQKWCLDEENPNYRKCPDYVVRMMAYIFEMEKA